jgi:phospholipase C
MHHLAAAVVSLLLVVMPFAPVPAAGGPAPDDLAVPRYKHIFVIMGENKDWFRIDGSANAPRLAALAKAYGDATHFYGEVHPSEANYVALVGGSTFGIHDDDAYYCTPGSTRPSCQHAGNAGYATHSLDAPHLGTQLEAAGLSWKNYNESIPEAGSLAVVGSNPVLDGPNAVPYYASKHSGFINFASVQQDPQRTDRVVGYDALQRDLASGDLPSFGLIIPNLCNDMHGMKAGAGVPDDCVYEHLDALIQRGDAAMGKTVDAIMASATWRSSDNVAVVVTFDEDDGTGREGCCGVTPNAPSNFGGGHIATIVITNHGPRGIVDATPYNHYSLLRTIEDAFGIRDYLGLAGASSQGVKPMLPLFRVSAKRD